MTEVLKNSNNKLYIIILLGVLGVVSLIVIIYLATRKKNTSTGNNTPTPSPSPSHTPTPSPSHTPTPSPSHTPTPSPHHGSHTPSPSPSPTPTEAIVIKGGNPGSYILKKHANYLINNSSQNQEKGCWTINDPLFTSRWY